MVQLMLKKQYKIKLVYLLVSMITTGIYTHKYLYLFFPFLDAVFCQILWGKKIKNKSLGPTTIYNHDFVTTNAIISLLFGNNNPNK